MSEEIKKPYWHMAADKELEQLITESTSINFIKENYRQPDWCEMPDALDFTWGCWTLSDLKLRKTICKKFCSSCECYKRKK
jgi:hypothetical protein